MAGIAAFASVAVVSKQIKTRREVTYSVPSTERLLNAKHFSRLPPKSVARQEALWQDTLREGSVRALCQGREIQQQRAYLPLKRSSPRPRFYRRRQVREDSRNQKEESQNAPGPKGLLVDRTAGCGRNHSHHCGHRNSELYAREDVGPRVFGRGFAPHD